jgi:hypothetical protein
MFEAKDITCDPWANQEKVQEIAAKLDKTAAVRIQAIIRRHDGLFPVGSLEEAPKALLKYTHERGHLGSTEKKQLERITRVLNALIASKVVVYDRESGLLALTVAKPQKRVHVDRYSAGSRNRRGRAA